MSDDKAKTGPQDASKISLSEDYEVQYWTKTLGVSREELEKAVKSAGNGADSVLDFSRIEAGEIELKPQATNIEALFGETLDQFRDKATECVSACKSDPHLGDIGVQKWL